MKSNTISLIKKNLEQYTVVFVLKLNCFSKYDF